MFGELPKLFDRNFVIAFFLPAAVFLVASLYLWAGFGLISGLFPTLKNDALQGATILGVTAWLVGVLLLTLNYSIYRVLEGYNDYNPIQYLKPLEQWRFRRLQHSLDKLRAEIREGLKDGEEEEVLDTLRTRRDALRRKQVGSFPDEDRILATSFGNTLRAFEDYPTDMYGVDSIVVWVRLMAVIPKDYLGLIDTAKAQTDFWVNLWMIGYLLVIEYISVAAYMGQLKLLWFPLAAIVLVLIASSRAKAEAIAWGDYVKAAFDLFLPDLRAKLQLPFPKDIKEERELWTKFSQVVIYHQKEKVASRVPPPVTAKSEQATSPNANTG